MALDINNILQSLPQVDQSTMPAWARPPQTNIMQQTAPVAAEPPRQRRSFLDTIGRISDVLAKVGGADALYQPTLDADAARMQQVDLDAMRKQQMEQQLQAGKIGIENEERTRFGQALGGLIGAPDAAALWPQLAEQAGIPPDKAAAIGMAIQQNPNIIEPLAMSFGYKPEKEGSLPSAVQNYAMYQKILTEQGPDAAKQFLQFAQPATVMNPYQEAQVGLNTQKFGLDQEELDLKRRELALKEAKDERTASGAVDLTPTQRGTVRQKLQLLPNIASQVARVKQLAGEMAQEGTLARGALGGLVPGAVAGGKAERFDKAMGMLRKSILTLTRVPGVGSMSDYESRLDEQAIPSRWGSDEGRAEALQNIESLVGSLNSGYKEMLGTTAAPSNGRRKIVRRGTNQSSGNQSSGGWSIVGVK